MLNQKSLFPVFLFLFLLPLGAQTIAIHEDLELINIQEGFWIHRSFINYPGYGRIGANGFLVIKDHSALLVDTPWNDDQSLALCSWLENHWGTKIDLVIVTHFHDDNLGGLAGFHSKGVRSLALEKTKKICKDKDLPLPQEVFQDRISFQHQGIPVEVRYFGEGHAPDNICVYFPDQKLLFGGCLVRAHGTRGLGNTEDANLIEWPISLRALLEAYPQAQVVIPGHGRHGGLELIHHSLSLFKNEKVSP